MNISQTIRKLPALRNGFLCVSSYKSNIICYKSTNDASSSSSSSSDSSSDMDDVPPKTKSNSEAVKKLNTLLEQMVMNDQLKSAQNLKLAQPRNRRIQNGKKDESVTSEPLDKQVINAVKDVAELIGGDSKKTESELLLKLLQPTDVKETASTLSDVIKGMKIEREAKPSVISKADQVRKVLQRVSQSGESSTSLNVQRKPRQFQPKSTDQMSFERIDLFGNGSLGIFTDPSKLRDSSQLKTWEMLQQKELKLAVTHPPQNYFQQIILWTEQGKVWQFPINNEFGLEEEAKVYFADHIFLEEHLEPWCPTKGPIRHFMELVCVGLSKNPYQTVEAKKEHIEWYKNYFEDKRQLLEEIGAFPAARPLETETQNIE